jgi:hypothetical protein
MSLLKILRTPRAILFIVWLFSFVLLTFKTVPVSGDGIYYYAYLRSMVIDGDLDFQNDLPAFHDSNPHVAKQLDSGVTTPAGRTPNLFSIGPALLWMPVYLFAHGMALTLAPYTGQVADGFSAIELFAPSLATSLYGLLGLALAFYFLRRMAPRASPYIIAGSIAAVFFGSNLFYYLTFEASMSHGLGFFAVTALLAAWSKWRASKTFWQWLLIGALAGLAGLVRWQLLGVALVIPALDLIFLRRSLLALKHLLLVAIGAAIFFIPQLIAWKAIYGSYLIVPQGTGFFDLSSPHFLEVLISNRHGLLTWTPLFIIAGLGLILGLTKKFRSSFAGWALLIIVVQAYINGTALEWWGGEAFGARRFTDISVVFMFGLVILLSSITILKRKKIPHLLAWSLIGILIVANLVFMQVYRRDLIPRGEPVRFSTVVRAVQQLY